MKTQIIMLSFWKNIFRIPFALIVFFSLYFYVHSVTGLTAAEERQAKLDRASASATAWVTEYSTVAEPGYCPTESEMGALDGAEDKIVCGNAKDGSFKYPEGDYSSNPDGRLITATFPTDSTSRYMAETFSCITCKWNVRLPTIKPACIETLPTNDYEDCTSSSWGACDSTATNKSTEQGKQKCTRSVKTNNGAPICDGSSSIDEYRDCGVCQITNGYQGTSDYKTPTWKRVSDSSVTGECPETGVADTLTATYLRDDTKIKSCGPYKTTIDKTCAPSCALPNVTEDRPNQSNYPIKEGSTDISDYDCTAWSACPESGSSANQKSTCSRIESKYCSGKKTLNENTPDAPSGTPPTNKQVRACIANSVCTPTEIGNGEGTAFPVKKYYSCGLGTYNSSTGAWSGGIGQWDASTCKNVTQESGINIKVVTRKCVKISNQCIGPVSFDQKKDCSICTKPDPESENVQDNSANTSNYICGGWTSCQLTDDLATTDKDESRKQYRNCTKRANAYCAGPGVNATSPLIQERDCQGNVGGVGDYTCPDPTVVQCKNSEDKNQVTVECIKNTLSYRKKGKDKDNFSTDKCRQCVLPVTTTAGPANIGDYSCPVWSDCPESGATADRTRTCKRIISTSASLTAAGTGNCSGKEELSSVDGQKVACIASSQCIPTAASTDGTLSNGKKYYSCDPWNTSECKGSATAADLTVRTCTRTDKGCIGPDTVNKDTAGYEQKKACTACVAPNTLSDSEIPATAGGDYSCKVWSFCPKDEVGVVKKQTRLCKKEKNCYGDGILEDDNQTQSWEERISCSQSCVEPQEQIGSNGIPINNDTDPNDATKDYYCGNWGACNNFYAADPGESTRTCLRRNRNCLGRSEEIIPSGKLVPQITQSVSCPKCTADEWDCDDETTTKAKKCTVRDGSEVQADCRLKNDCKAINPQTSAEVDTPKPVQTYTCPGGTADEGEGFPSAGTNATLHYTGSAWKADTFLYNDGLKIGIGLKNLVSSAPTSILDINGAFTLRGTTLYNPPPTPVLNSGMGIIYFDGKKFKFSENGSAYKEFGSGGSGGGSSQWADLSDTSGITYQGNIGVGTVAPRARLHVEENVNGTAKISVFNPNNGGISALSLSVSSVFEDRGGRFEFRASGNEMRLINDGDPGGIFTFWTRSSSPDATAERMRITDKGFVGIGTTTPSSELDINGILTVEGKTSADKSPAGTGRIYFDTAKKKFQVSENGQPYADLGSGAGDECSGSLFYGFSSTSYVYNASAKIDYVKADALCGVGAHVCSGQEMIKTMRCKATVFDGFKGNSVDEEGWLNTGPPGAPTKANDCSGWTTNSAYVYGAFWKVSEDTTTYSKYGYGLVGACNKSTATDNRPFACCKK